MKRILSILATLTLLTALTASAVWADPPRPTKGWSYTLYKNAICLVRGEGGGYKFWIPFKYTWVRVTGTSANKEWRFVMYKSIPLTCQSDLLSTPVK